MRVILHELDGVPNLGSDELKDARDRAITLELTNRFAHVRGALRKQHFNIILTFAFRSASPRKSALGSI